MSVKLKDLTVKVAVETDEVLLCLVGLAKTVRSGGDYTSLLPAFIKAIENVSDVPAEAKEAVWAVVRSAVNRGVDVAEALTAPKVVPAIG